MSKDLFNPGPSSLRTARMLSYRIPRPTTSFPGPSGGGKPGLGVPRMGRALGGPIPDDPAQPQVGPILSASSGRADAVPMHVPTGAYVIPAANVAHIGDGNTLTGFKVLNAMFNPKPFGATAGPWGSPLGQGVRGKGVPMPQANLRPVPQLRQPGNPTPTAPGPAGPDPRMQIPMQRGMPGMPQGTLQKFGGPVESQAPATPIAASGGEFIIPPGEVKRRGGGDLAKGHQILDAWMKALMKDHIKTLKSLPGPAQD